MAEQQTIEKQPTTTDPRQNPAIPEQKASPWILILWILIPILFLIGITVWRS